MINLVAHSRARAFAFTGSAKPGSLSHPEQQCSHIQVQGRVLKPGAKETVISEVIMLLSVPLVVFPLSALSLTGIKLALNFAHSRTQARQCMTWYSSPSQADSRNSISQQEPAHGHIAWEISCNTRSFYISLWQERSQRCLYSFNYISGS